MTEVNLESKNILMILNRYYPMIGGAEQQARTLARFLRSNFDYNIKVISTDHLGTLKRLDTLDGNEVHRISDLKYGMLFFYIKLFFILVFKYKNFKVIHCHSISVTSFICAISAKLTKRKCILKLTISGEIDRLLSGNGVLAKIKSAMIRYALNNSTVIALTKEGKAELNNFGVKEYVQIPNGVDELNVRSGLDVMETTSNDNRIFGFLGRFCVQKGIPELLNAFENCNYKSELRLMGSSEHQLSSDIDKVINSKAETLGSRLTRLEPINPPYEFYKQLTHFVSASKYEGLPNVVLEALSFGLPCILSDIAPHKEIENACDSPYVKTFDSNEVLISLLDQMPIRQERTSLLPRKFSMTIVAESYDNLYKKLFFTP
ncbi:MAG: glycosyltransferase involved in cell wall biosynthesis [Psychroserpens sp.]|jgi:glycosyltransferase involved in cell wall biosynthesis